jgi:hypothetical protein
MLLKDEAGGKPMSMYVSLEFKAFKNRLKVMIRKAKDLPDSRGLVTKILELKKKYHVIDYLSYVPK